MTPEVVINYHCQLGEGPLWDDRQHVLWWVNIVAGELHRHDPKTEENSIYKLGQMVGTVGLREKGGLILAVENGFATFDPDTETLTPIVDPEADKPKNRFNDGKPAPDGSFFAGTMGKEIVDGVGSFYRLNKDGTADHLLSGITVSNGMAWTADQKTMYYIDTPTHCVYAFDYDNQSGNISQQRVAFHIPEEIGDPDGMCIDSEDMLWIAFYDGSAIHRWNPQTGERLLTLEMPTKNITCCTFGGENMDTLYITTAGGDLGEDDLAGALFKVKAPVSGKKAFRYNG